MQWVCGDIKNAGLLDFVSAWYIKAARYMSVIASEARQSSLSPSPNGLLRHGVPRNDSIRCAFVSTNSITQGEQVGVLWAWMLAQGVKIHFAHRTFSWSNEARGKAAVHCVIIGFGLQEAAEKIIYKYEDIKGEPHAVKASNINPYLVDAPDLIIDKARKPICNVPEMSYGSMANDDGFLLLSDIEKQTLLIKEPLAEKWVKKFVMGDELINNISRWCLWLEEIKPNELRNLPEILRRVEQVRLIRVKSTREATRELANTPNLFGELRQPSCNYLALPRVSSENRRFIPITFLKSEVIAEDKVYTIEKATIFHFGILTSTMHMAWMRTTAGRMKSDYSYTNQITYNNFPWPVIASEAKQSKTTVEASQRHQEENKTLDCHHATLAMTAKIEVAAQAVLDARAAHANASLADLYDPLTMPANLLKAHQALDKAVDAAYGYKGANTDAARVAFLFALYQTITSLLPAEKAVKKKITKNKV